MIGKIAIGKSFGGCVRYVVNKKDAEILYGDGIRLNNTSLIVRDFDLQRKMNPELSKAVAHISLSWSEVDRDKLRNENMLAMAMEYLKLINIKNTQLLIVRHNDNHHPHLHIIYNRVDNNGKTISDQFQFKKNAAACKEITIKHGLFMAKDRDKVNRKALKGSDKIRYLLFDQIKSAQKSSRNWESFGNKLSSAGIEMVFKYKNGSNEIQGVSFKSGEYTFKGSEIDRSLSYGKLNAFFQDTSVQQDFTKINIPEREFSESSPGKKTFSESSKLTEILEILFAPTFSPLHAEPEPRKKKKKGTGYDEEQSQGRGR
ncbi:relaxase/mobilization nuclease domain-containing protein [Pedobacter sp. R20-19]|uniref:relaxase/mobilization nuclease domain-containing protein n=1 Tax=Pedobacter sp. R20-19 TaxID=1270196 RepID=UPI000493AC7B|nr:relaxase/mobilization nuclease domain-containing protein [Pedobacter sp. R20-19]